MKKTLFVIALIVLLSGSLYTLYQIIHNQPHYNGKIDFSAEQAEASDDIVPIEDLDTPEDNDILPPSIKDIPEEPEEPIPPPPVDILISAIGDCTIGHDDRNGFENTLPHELQRQGNDYGYFFSNVKDIFAASDLVIANLEGTFTASNNRQDKSFTFRGDPSLVRILQEGHVNAVNLANNHTIDYGEQGYIDTMKTLEKAEIAYFGYENYHIESINDIRIGMLGYTLLSRNTATKEGIANAINNIRDKCDILIVSFHWGVELATHPNETQKNFGRYVIDLGADLVLGHHPHVIQGIEKYNDKYIVYSLGNFCFGGNRNPKDKDTFIFQQKFTMDPEDREIINTKINIIPASISSVSHRNDYRPTPLEGEEGNRVLKKLIKRSEGMGLELKVE